MLEIFGSLDIASQIIIVGILAACLLFIFAELRITNKFRKGLNPIKELSSWLNGEPGYIELSALKDGIKNLLYSNFITKSSEDGKTNLVKKDGRFLISSAPTSLLPSLPTSPNRFVPALLTTAGVLGTFLGISLGLVDFDPGSDSKKLMSSAITLMGGMKTAFFTSLVGMFTSLLFMLLLFVESKRRESKYKKILADMTSICRTVSPVSLLHNIAPVNQEELIAKQLKAAQRTLVSNNEIIKYLQKISTEFKSEGIVEAITTGIHESVSKEISPVLNSISTEIKVLKDIKEENGQEIIRLIVDAMKEEVIQPFESHIGEMTKVTESSAKAMENLTSELANVMSGLSDTTETLNEFQKDTLTKLNDFAESLQGILGQFQSSTEVVLDRVAEEIKNAIAESISGMKSQREAFEASARVASEAFVQQNDTLKSVGEESSQLMNDAKENLLEGLSSIDEKVKSMSEVVQSELEKFRVEYQQNLTGFFEKQANLLEDTLGEQREGLAGVVTDFRDVFKEENELREKQLDSLLEHHTKQVESVKIVRELIEAVGLSNSAVFNQIEDASKSVSEQVGLMRKEYSNASERFSAITERMPEAMSEYFEKAKETHEAFFTNFDDAAAKVHGKLAEAANLLVTAMQQVDMQLNGKPLEDLV